ncbi:phosphate ABC transporter permease subunit PstC [Colwellia sp. E150_009]|jgi:phosphate transport system permease protein|tara:strand:+ start:81 stop:1514 length:1434 start_codon:yes stop_codon:yes gene_type:complete
MNSSLLFIVLLCLTLFSYWFGIKRSLKVAGGAEYKKSLISLPEQFGLLTAMVCGLPALITLLIFNSTEQLVIEQLLTNTLPIKIQQLSSIDLGLYLNNIRSIASTETSQTLLQNISSQTLEQTSNASLITQYQGALTLQTLNQQASWLKTALVLIIAVVSVIILVRKFSPTFKARQKAEAIIWGLLVSSSAIAILTTVGIIVSVLFESIHFFKSVSPAEFMFGTQWSPQTAMRVDQVGGSGSFGAVPLFAGTMLITFIAMLLAVPVGLMIAIYLSQYADARLRRFAKPMLEVLAGIPTVVYGFFAALTVAPVIRNLGESFGLSVASESALAAGLVMGTMIIPFVSSLSEDAISAVPNSLKEASLGMGSTRSETVINVLLPAALPGIVGAILLAISRAIGETMIVVMAAGMAANLTANPLDSVTTVTVQIVTLLTGDQEFDSPKTLAAFALGLMLFITTLGLNILALKVVRKYREQYD